MSQYSTHSIDASDRVAPSACPSEPTRTPRAGSLLAQIVVTVLLCVAGGFAGGSVSTGSARPDAVQAPVVGSPAPGSAAWDSVKYQWPRR
jgi:hypothetical protein